MSTSTKLDAVFYDRDAEKPDNSTVRIAVEHENMPNLAHDEVRKLVEYNFPLSVLITYAWNGKTGGHIVDPQASQTWFTQKFGSILASKENLGQFLIIIPDETIAEERTWYYYAYLRQSFEKL